MSDGHRATRVLGALNDFFSGFLPAYAEGCAPDAAALPYITYPLTVPEPLGEASFYVRVWFSGAGFGEAAAVVDAIDAAIGPGCCLPVEGGAVWLYKEEGFARFVPSAADERVKCAYLGLKVAACV